MADKSIDPSEQKIQYYIVTQKRTKISFKHFITDEKRPDQDLDALMREWQDKYGPKEERKNFYRENPVTSAGILAGFGWAAWRVISMNKNLGKNQGSRGVNLGSLRTYYLLETRVFAQMGIVGALLGAVLYQAYQ